MPSGGEAKAPQADNCGPRPIDKDPQGPRSWGLSDAGVHGLPGTTSALCGRQRGIRCVFRRARPADGRLWGTIDMSWLAEVQKAARGGSL